MLCLRRQLALQVEKHEISAIAFVKSSHFEFFTLEFKGAYMFWNSSHIRYLSFSHVSGEEIRRIKEISCFFPFKSLF